MQNYYIFSEKNGTPVLDDSGNPLTWLDLMADLARWAETEGFRLEIAQNEQGEDMFRIVEVTQ